MKTCEFCEYATDECLILGEPIEYEPSGMTAKSNCPIRLRDKYIKDIESRIEKDSFIGFKP